MEGPRRHWCSDRAAA